MKILARILTSLPDTVYLPLHVDTLFFFYSHCLSHILAFALLIDILIDLSISSHDMLSGNASWCTIMSHFIPGIADGFSLVTMVLATLCWILPFTSLPMHFNSFTILFRINQALWL